MSIFLRNKRLFYIGCIFVNIKLKTLVRDLSIPNSNFSLLPDHYIYTFLAKLITMFENELFCWMNVQKHLDHVIIQNSWNETKLFYFKENL